MSEEGRTSPKRLDVFGDSLLNKLPSASRKRRKRQASKRRRVQLRKDDIGGSEPGQMYAD